MPYCRIVYNIAMRILFLDDNENRHKLFHSLVTGHGITHIDWAENALAAIEFLNNNPKYDLICFDHDLSEEHYRACMNGNDANYGDVMTGYDVAVFLVTELEEEKQPEYAIVHTFNPDGSKRIAAVLSEAGLQKSIYVFPFSQSGLEQSIELITIDHGNKNSNLL